MKIAVTLGCITLTNQVNSELCLVFCEQTTVMVLSVDRNIFVVSYLSSMLQCKPLLLKM